MNAERGSRWLAPASWNPVSRPSATEIERPECRYARVNPVIGRNVPFIVALSNARTTVVPMAITRR
jgi:hypothetical protein